LGLGEEDSRCGIAAFEAGVVAMGPLIVAHENVPNLINYENYHRMVAREALVQEGNQRH
jgi:hypothetical protein